MKVEFRNTFVKDLKKIDNKFILNKIKDLIIQIEETQSIYEISNIKHLVNTDNLFRIRVGDYRIGIKTSNDIVIIIRCIHRKDFYKSFP